MDNDAFFKAYIGSRNGCNKLYMHWCIRSFNYSDGVKECADAGCAWLVDIVATEIPQAMRKHRKPHCMFEVSVKDSKAHLQLTHQDDAPPIWQRDIEYTDMPDGEYVFEICDEGNRVAMILITEH